MGNRSLRFPMECDDPRTSYLPYKDHTSFPRVVSWSTSADGHCWLSSGAATIAEDSCLLDAGPARAAAEVRDRRAWTQRRHIRHCLALPPRATPSRVHLPNTSCALTVVFDRSVRQASRRRARLVRVVVRRCVPTTGARAPVARVPESSSLVLGSAHCQQRTQRATRASTLMHSTADFSAVPPRSRLRGPHA